MASSAISRSSVSGSASPWRADRSPSGTGARRSRSSRVEAGDAALEVAQHGQPALQLGDEVVAVAGTERARRAQRLGLAGIEQRAGRRVGGAGRLETVARLKLRHGALRVLAVAAGTAAVEVAGLLEEPLQAAHLRAGIARRGGGGLQKRLPAQRLAGAQAQLRRAVRRAGLGQAVRQLKALDRGLRRFAEHAVADAGEVAQIAQPALQLGNDRAGAARLQNRQVGALVGERGQVVAAADGFAALQAFERGGVGFAGHLEVVGGLETADRRARVGVEPAVERVVVVAEGVERALDFRRGGAVGRFRQGGGEDRRQRREQGHPPHPTSVHRILRSFVRRPEITRRSPPPLREAGGWTG